MSTSDERPTPNDPPAPDQQPPAVDNAGNAAPPSAGHETGGGHDDMGKGSSGS